MTFAIEEESRGGAADETRNKSVRKAGQIPDFTEYGAALNLVLNVGRADTLTISFQALGPKFRGLIGVVAYFSMQGAGPTLVGSSFQINYEEDPVHAETRFSNWLEQVLVEGLGEWRRTL
jgi:hypothetical protein